MNPTPQSALRRGTVLVTFPIALAALLFLFWRDVFWVRDIILALGFVTTAFACFVFAGYRMAQDREIGRITVFLPFVFLGLALVSVIANLESVFR